MTLWLSSASCIIQCHTVGFWTWLTWEFREPRQNQSCPATLAIIGTASVLPSRRVASGSPLRSLCPALVRGFDSARSYTPSAGELLITLLSRNADEKRMASRNSKVRKARTITSALFARCIFGLGPDSAARPLDNELASLLGTYYVPIGISLLCLSHSQRFFLKGFANSVEMQLLWPK